MSYHMLWNYIPEHFYKKDNDIECVILSPEFSGLFFRFGVLYNLREMMIIDKYFMQRAIELAAIGQGKTNPNPLVGAVIVKADRIIGEGFHERPGGAHAEVNAFLNATEPVEGAAMYVTLEPCAHYGKTPPCADMIIEKGIKRVVVGIKDPNPLVAGKGIQKLLDAGISVDVGILAEECQKQNEVFLKFIIEKKPYVILKAGMSLDGKVATTSGESQWITSKAARAHVHQLRNNYKGIMVGIDTVIADNPLLTCRIQGGRDPIRIIVDSRLRIPIDAKVLDMQNESKTIIATTHLADSEKIKALQGRGIDIIVTKSINGRVNLESLMTILGEKDIDSILLEGGPTLNYSALESGIVDKVMIYMAPMLIGGKSSKTAVEGEGIRKLSDAIQLEEISCRPMDKDILLEGYIMRQSTFANKNKGGG